MSGYSLLKNLILLGLSVVVYVAARLSIQEFWDGNLCPKILVIPACYIILAATLLAMLSHWLDRQALFFLSASIPFLFALAGSILQLIGKVNCPKSDSGIPMCFLSLGFFSVILFLKLLQLLTTEQSSKD